LYERFRSGNSPVPSILMESSQRAPKRQRCARSCPGNKIDLQFVNAKPDDQNQRRETKAIVRANAAHFHWRHNRPPQDEAKLKPSKRGTVSRQVKSISRPLRPMNSTQLEAGASPFSTYNCNFPTSFVYHCVAFSTWSAPIDISRLMLSRC
jgi:hypothetical protein